MIIDTSAVLAILLGEPDARLYAEAIAASAQNRMGAPTLFEAKMVAEGRAGPHGRQRLVEFLAESAMEILPFTPRHADLAEVAWRQFGKRRHRANLNYGDCMAYAIAAAAGEPLLFKGDDFIHTDIDPALKR